MAAPARQLATGMSVGACQDSPELIVSWVSSPWSALFWLQVTVVLCDQFVFQMNAIITPILLCFECYAHASFN